ncbi:hypothetical protein G7Y79_00053g088320 [Physcia stellaris]|nr:hypothetical protein G7Y79_00053g088320 [Physcia stellaris]
MVPKSFIQPRRIISKMKAPTNLGRLLGNSIDSYGFTHALRIPLPTPTSRPQFERSFQQIKSDPVASDVHPAAFSPPDIQYLDIGALVLQTPQAKEDALGILRDLQLDRNLYEGRSGSHHSPKPMVVSVAGLVHNDVLHDCRRLYAPVHDHSGKLSDFMLSVKEVFLSAGLMVRRKNEDTPRAKLHTRIIGNKRVRTKVPNQSAHIRRKLAGTEATVTTLASWDLRELYDKYRNFSWAADFALERLSIVDIHAGDIWKDGRVIGRGSQEFASVPLPGITYIGEQSALQNVTYNPTPLILI